MRLDPQLFRRALIYAMSGSLVCGAMIAVAALGEGVGLVLGSLACVALLAFALAVVALDEARKP